MKKFKEVIRSTEIILEIKLKSVRITHLNASFYNKENYFKTNINKGTRVELKI